MKKARTSKLLYSLILFLAIFNPPIYPGFSFTVVTCIISFIFLLKNWSLVKTLYRNLPIRKFIKANILLYILYGVSVFLQLGHNKFETYLVDYFTSIIYFILVLIVASAFVIYAIKKEYNKEYIIDCFIYAALIECIFVVISFVFPPAKTLFLSLMSWRVEEANEFSFNYSSEFRNYGLASSLYDIFAYTMSILSMLALYKGKTKPLYYLLFIVIVFCGMINARTTIVLVFFGLLVYSAKSFGHFVRSTVTIGLVTVLFVLIIFPMLLEIGNLDRLLAGVEEIWLTITTGQASGYFDTLLNEFIFFPDSILGLILGKGDTPLVVIDYGSDIGYIQAIWRYGLVGSFIVYSSHVKLFRDSKINNERYCSLINANIVMFLLYQVKLSSLGYSQASVIYYTFLFSLLVLPNNESSLLSGNCNKIKEANSI